MKNYQKMLAMLLAVAMCFAMSSMALAAPAVSEDLPSDPYTAEMPEKPASSDVHATITDEDNNTSETIIPVYLSAEATILDVTVPTAFPIAMDGSGETTTPDAITVTNNSFGAIVVKNIMAKDNARTETTADWHLAAFDTDMSLEKVDANKVGLAVAPKGGKNNADGTDYLATDDSNAVQQTLLDGVDSKWVVDGATADRDTDVLTINYEANASAVSHKLTNKVIADVVLTVAWYTDD